MVSLLIHSWCILLSYNRRCVHI